MCGCRKPGPCREGLSSVFCVGFFCVCFFLAVTSKNDEIIMIIKKNVDKSSLSITSP